MVVRIPQLAVLFEGGLLALAIGLGWILGTPLLSQADFGWAGLATGAIATGVPLVGLWWCTWTRWAPLRRLMCEVDQVVVAFAGCSYLELALVSMLAGLGEEVLFRGVLQAALAQWLEPWGAWIVASGLFGLGHFVTPTYGVVASLFGLYLGALVLLSGNLVPAIIVHALYDFCAFVYLLRRAVLYKKPGEQPRFEDRIAKEQGHQ